MAKIDNDDSDNQIVYEITLLIKFSSGKSQIYIFLSNYIQLSLYTFKFQTSVFEGLLLQTLLKESCALWLCLQSNMPLLYWHELQSDSTKGEESSSDYKHLNRLIGSMSRSNDDELFISYNIYLCMFVFYWSSLKKA